MTKSLIITLHFSFLVFSFSFAQTWVPLGAGLKDTTNSVAQVWTLCPYGDKLYAGGMFKQAGNLKANHIASWDGEKWDSLKNGTNGWVEALFVYHNQLCVGGTFTQAGKKRVDFLARWIDTANMEPDWYNLGSTFVALKKESSSRPSPYFVGPFAEYHDQLYLGGVFGYWGCTINHVGVFNNGKWNSLSSSKYSVNGDTSRKAITTRTWRMGSGLAVYNDKLFATGLALLDDGNSPSGLSRGEDVASWDDKKSTVSFLTPKNYSSPYASCLTVYNSQLYAAGIFTVDGNKSVPTIAFWDNDHWSPLPDPPNAEILTMLVYDGKLYVGGDFDSAGGKPIKAIAAWDGHTWEAVGKGFTEHSHTGNVDALAIYNGELYAAGWFNASGMQPLNNIARLKLSGTKPTPTPTKKNKND